jgi:hypothetical protein
MSYDLSSHLNRRYSRTEALASTGAEVGQALAPFVKKVGVTRVRDRESRLGIGMRDTQKNAINELRSRQQMFNSEATVPKR